MFGPVERRNHAQQVCFLPKLGGAPENMQPGGNEALFDLDQLFVKLQDPSVSLNRIAIRCH